MTDMPLTLHFEPEPINDGRPEMPFKPIVVVQPSRDEEGRIFIGVNPFGKNVGCHLLPDEARRIRDHLNKLLLEDEVDISDAVSVAVEEGKKTTPETAWTPEQLLEWKRKRDQGASKRPRRAPLARFKRPQGPQFRLEFKWGKLEAIVARLSGR